MKISERCKKQIEDIEKLANEFKVLGESEPHKVVMWDRDFESITELYLAYKSTIDQLEDITKLYNKANDYIDDFEKSEDRCATLETENEDLKDALEKSTETSHGLYEENRRLHNTINILRADNSNQSHEIHKLKEENKKLCEKFSELRTIKKSFEVLRALYLGDYENDEPF